MTLGLLSTFQMIFLVAGTAGLICFLYWLKPPPQRFVVPSTLIWKRVLQERKRRNDFWRWLVSLLVALLIGLALAVSLGQPEMEVLSGRARRIAIVVDNSPTMTTVMSSGLTRWEFAVEKVSELLAEGSVTSEYLLTDTGGTLPSSGFTNRTRAFELLSELSPVMENKVRFPWVDVSLPSSADETIETEVYFVSDGVLVSEVPANVKTVSVFETAANVGITAFDLKTVPAEITRNESFLELSNFGLESIRVGVQVQGTGGASLDRVVSLRPGQVMRESLDMDSFISGPIRVLIDAPGDAFTLDNVAYSYIEAPRLVRTVLVTEGNDYLETLLNLDPRVSLEIVTPENFLVPATSEELPDLFVFDRFASEEFPPAPVLLLQPPNASWLPVFIEKEKEELSLSGISSGHPLLAHVSLEDVVIELDTYVESGDYEVVAGTVEQPILLVGEAPARWAQLVFNLNTSNFPIQEGFPIFLSNALSWLPSTDVFATSLRTVTVPESLAVVNSTDGGEVDTVAVGGSTIFTPNAPNLFSVRTANGDHVVAANLLDPAVSEVNTSFFLGNNSEVSVDEILEGSVGGSELWFLLVFAALVVILLEWWTYHRRLTI